MSDIDPQAKPPPAPATVEEIDAQLQEYRKALARVSKRSRIVVVEQIDALLDRRLKLSKALKRRARAAA